MNKFTQKAFLFSAFLSINIAFSQVGIGTTTPNADALLDVDATVSTGGILLPRLGLSDTSLPAPLSTDVAGMIVYNTATAGDVTPGFYYNDGAVWVRLGAAAASNDWTITGNAGTTAGTNFIGTTDLVDLRIHTNNTERARIGDTGRIGINGIDQTWAQTFSASADATIDALVGYSSVDDGTGVYGRAQGANGYGVWGSSADGIGVVGTSTNAGGWGMYARSTDGLGLLAAETADGVGVQAQVTSETGVPIVAIQGDQGLGIYAETSGAGNNADSGFAVYATIDQATDSGNEDTAPIAGVHSTRVDGRGYASPITATTSSGMAGVTGVVASKFTGANGNEYLFGVIGEVLVDTNVGGAVIPDAIGGVLGTNGTGDFGILGYIAQNGTYYSVYGGGANGSIAAGNTGRSSGQNSANSVIGLGMNGGFMGGYLKGSQYGIVSKGEEFGSYTMGNNITNSPIIQLENTQGNRVATYATTSTSVDLSTRGKSTLTNGTTYVTFDKSFAKLIDAENIHISVTPTGETKGVYVTGITANGFTVKENMSGSSNANFNWTVTATKKAYKRGVELSQTILSSDFDKNMNSVMHNDHDTTNEGTPIYFDGNDVKFIRNPNKRKGNGAKIIKRKAIDLKEKTAKKENQLETEK